MSSIKNYFSSSGKSSESLKTAVQIAGTKTSITSTEEREVISALEDAELPKIQRGEGENNSSSVHVKQYFQCFQIKIIHGTLKDI